MTSSNLPICMAKSLYSHSISGNAGSPDDTFPWAAQSPQLAQQAGNCSVLTSTADSYHGNFASDAGAVMFSTNTSTSAFSCNALIPASNLTSTCPGSLWSNNTVSKNSTLALYGYGTSIASLPASIVLDVAPMINYVSNGNVKLPLTVYVLDQGGLNVTSGEMQGLQHSSRTFQSMPTASNACLDAVCLKTLSLCLLQRCVTFQESALHGAIVFHFPSTVKASQT